MKPAPFGYADPALGRRGARVLLAEGDGRQGARRGPVAAAAAVHAARGADHAGGHQPGARAGPHRGHRRTASGWARWCGTPHCWRRPRPPPVQPLLARATANVAHPAIRNRGTTVGSIAHADPSGRDDLGARPDRRLGHGRRRRGRHRDGRLARPVRRPAGDLGARPGRRHLDAFFPALPARSGTAFAEVARRKGDYAVCGAGVVVTLDDDRRVAVGRAAYLSVGLVPEVHDLTDAVAGKPVDGADWAAAGELARTPGRARTATCTPAPTTGGCWSASLTERTLAAAAAEAAREDVHDASTPNGPSRVTVNGVPREAPVPARRLLSDALRHDLGLTGTHVGCEHGVCGACTVLVDGGRCARA